MRHQVNEKIGPWVNEAIEASAKGEDIIWEPSLMPGPQGEAMVVCFFWMRGAVLGSTAQGSFSLHDPLGATKTEVVDTVKDFLSQMFAARAEQIGGEVPGSEREAETIMRGQRRSSGLLIP